MPAPRASPPLVVDASARVVASGYREFAQHFPAEDRVEHDLGEVWSATIAATSEALENIDRAACRRDRNHEPARDVVPVGSRDDGVHPAKRSCGRTDVPPHCATAFAARGTKHSLRTARVFASIRISAERKRYGSPRTSHNTGPT